MYRNRKNRLPPEKSIPEQFDPRVKIAL